MSPPTDRSVSTDEMARRLVQRGLASVVIVDLSSRTERKENQP
jgi:hypothetical protein